MPTRCVFLLLLRQVCTFHGHAAATRRRQVVIKMATSETTNNIYVSVSVCVCVRVGEIKKTFLIEYFTFRRACAPQSMQGNSTLKGTYYLIRKKEENKRRETVHREVNAYHSFAFGVPRANFKVKA